MLEVELTHRFGDFALDLGFSAGPGLTALFGRSGSGKTSVVKLIAGLVRPDRGRVVVDGTVLVDTARGLWVPPHRRRIGYVFQDARLFPHLSVQQNLFYGRRVPGGGRQAAGDGERDEPDRIIDLLGIGHLLARRPGALSGGERQRVAIGRALLAFPRLLLLDEPFASLDAARKEEILPYVERLRDQTRIPVIYVSHSIPEVARLASTVVLLSDGRVDAAGPVADIMGRLDLYPKTGRFEAGAVLEARVIDQDERYGLTRLACPGGMLEVPRIEAPSGAAVRVRIRARDVIVAIDRPTGLSARNVLAGKIGDLGPVHGPMRDLSIALPGASLNARLTLRSIDELGLAHGKAVFAVIKSVAIDGHGFGPEESGVAPAGDA